MRNKSGVLQGALQTGDMAHAALHKAAAPPRQRIASAALPPVYAWALIGLLIFAFQVFVLGRWVTGPNFVATLPGPEPISEGQRLYFIALQVAVPAIAAFMLWHYLVKPWRRNGGITTDGRLIAAFAMIFFWDMSMNYSSTVLFYNAHMFNRGAWTLGSWPSWYSPNANVLPEPILVTLPGYTALVFSQLLLICALLRKCKARWPQMGVVSVIACVVVGLTVVDSLIEILLIRTGVYGYPGVIRAVTLFAGETYQFPLTEGFLFGGLGVGATTLLSFYRDDTGKTWAERGIEKVGLGGAGKQWLRFFAVFGFIHFFFFLLYVLPNQFISLNTDPFPEGYPSYMVNGMCVYGVNGNECPGPGVMMPRPPHQVTPGGLRKEAN